MPDRPAIAVTWKLPEDVLELDERARLERYVGHAAGVGTTGSRSPAAGRVHVVSVAEHAS
jgi:hypothetical protein